MKAKILNFADFVIYWSIILIPFFTAIAPAPENVFMAYLIFFYILKKALNRKLPFSINSVTKPLLFFFLATCISVIHTINLKDSLVGGILRLVQFSFVFFALSDEIRDKKHIKRILFSIVFALTLTSINEIWQVKFGKDFIRGYDSILNIGLVRATSSFKDSNTLGVYLSAFFPLLLGISLFLKIKFRWLICFFAILALVGIALTYSRPTLLAIYVVLFFFGIAKKQKILLISLILFTLISPLILPQTVKKWAKEVDYNPIRFMCNDDRIAIYLNSFNMIKAHPIIGVGANTFMKNYKTYKNNPEYRNVVTIDYIYAHNNIFHMIAEIGFIGFAMFLWLLFNLFKEARNIYLKLSDNYLKIIELSLIGCIIAFLVNGLTESSLYYSRVALLFWFLAGFSIGLKKFTNENSKT